MVTWSQGSGCKPRIYHMYEPKLDRPFHELVLSPVNPASMFGMYNHQNIKHYGVWSLCNARDEKRWLNEHGAPAFYTRCLSTIDICPSEFTPSYSLSNFHQVTPCSSRWSSHCPTRLLLHSRVPNIIWRLTSYTPVPGSLPSSSLSFDPSIVSCLSI